MDELIELWKTTWADYHIHPLNLYLALAVFGYLAYRDWYRTLLGAWAIVYAWTMGVVLTADSLNLSEGFLVVWVTGYGLIGFFVLGFLVFAALK